MTEVQQVRDKRTFGSRVASTVLVFTVPILLLAVLGLLTGSLDIGTLEIDLLLVVWLAGVVWVWWPRRR